MSIREELYKSYIKAIETMEEEDLEELLEYTKWFQADKEELAKEEYRELEEA